MGGGGLLQQTWSKLRDLNGGRGQGCEAHLAGQMEASGRKELMLCLCPKLAHYDLKRGKNGVAVNVTILPLALRDSVFQPWFSNNL